MDGFRSLLSVDRWAVPIPAARPFTINPAGAGQAVLLLHGFTGYPGELSIIGRALAEAGFAVSAPRLSGHGTARADLMAAGATDWTRRAFDAYMDLRSEYPVVHVLGHSMGGLLAVLAAVAFGAPRAMLLAPAFLVDRPALRLAPAFARFCPVIRRNRPPAETISPERLSLHSDYWADDLVAPAAQFRRVQRAARRRLGGLKSRVLVIVGEDDSLVPPTVVDYLRRRATDVASFDAVRLSGAGHCFPFETGADAAAKAAVDWLRT